MKHLFPLFVQNIFKIQYSSHIPFNSSAYIRISYFIQIRFSSLQKSHKSQNPIDTLRPSPKPNSTAQNRNATNIIFTLERISGEVRRHVQRRNSHRKQKKQPPKSHNNSQLVPHTAPNHNRQQNRDSEPRVQHPQLRTVRLFTRHWPTNDVGQQDVRNISATPSPSDIRRMAGESETVVGRCFFRQEDRELGDAQQMKGSDWSVVWWRVGLGEFAPHHFCRWLRRVSER